MKSYVTRIAATAAMTAVCLGATMQLGLPQIAYAIKEEKDAPVMMTVNGTDVRKGEYADYFNYCKAILETNSGMGPYVWSMEPSALEQLIQATDNNCLYARVVVDKFKELGLKLDRQKAWEYKQLRTSTEAQLKEQGIAFEDWLNSMGIDEDVYRNIMAQEYYLEAINEYYYGVNGEKAPEEEKIRAEFDKYYKAKHILIGSTDERGQPLPEDQLAKKKELVDEILKKLADGADFDELMNQYGEDPGQAYSQEGYIFQDNGQMVKEFVDGTKALKPGKIATEAVESKFGWHIIKREKLTEEDYQKYRPELIQTMTGGGMNELLNSWMEEAKVKYPEDHESLTLVDVLGEEAGKVPSIEDLMAGAASQGEDPSAQPESSSAE